MVCVCVCVYVWPHLPSSLWWIDQIVSCSTSPNSKFWIGAKKQLRRVYSVQIHNLQVVMFMQFEAPLTGRQEISHVASSSRKLNFPSQRLAYDAKRGGGGGDGRRKRAFFSLN